MAGTGFYPRKEARVIHTYSSYAPGADMTGGSPYFLDLTTLGRQDDCEEPKDRAADEQGAVPDVSTRGRGPGRL